MEREREPPSAGKKHGRETTMMQKVNNELVLAIKEGLEQAQGLASILDDAQISARDARDAFQKADDQYRNCLQDVLNIKESLEEARLQIEGAPPFAEANDAMGGFSHQRDAASSSGAFSS